MMLHLPSFLSFSGRIGRLHYLFGWVVLIILGIINDKLEMRTGNHIFSVVAFSFLWPWSAMTVQRMRDFGMHWKWLLIICALMILIMVGDVALVVMGLLSASTEYAVFGAFSIMLALNVVCVFMPGKVNATAERREPVFAEKS